MIVVDSSVWIAHFRDTPSDKVRKLRQIDQPNDILVGDLILLEILQGARSETDATRIEEALRQFEIVPMLDHRLAVQAAGFYRRLRREGATVRKTIDVIIAAFCISNNHVLLHDDRDFRPFSVHLGLRCL